MSIMVNYKVLNLNYSSFSPLKRKHAQEKAFYAQLHPTALHFEHHQFLKLKDVDLNHNEVNDLQ